MGNKLLDCVISMKCTAKQEQAQLKRVLASVAVAAPVGSVASAASATPPTEFESNSSTCVTIMQSMTSHEAVGMAAVGAAAITAFLLFNVIFKQETVEDQKTEGQTGDQMIKESMMTSIFNTMRGHPIMVIAAPIIVTAAIVAIILRDCIPAGVKQRFTTITNFLKSTVNRTPTPTTAPTTNTSVEAPTAPTTNTSVEAPTTNTTTEAPTEAPTETVEEGSGTQTPDSGSSSAPVAGGNGTSSSPTRGRTPSPTRGRTARGRTQNSPTRSPSRGQNRQSPNNTTRRHRNNNRNTRSSPEH